jgi:formylglycine-generating enzyme required for sulfatase activity
MMWQDPLFVDRRAWDDAVAACETLELAGYDDWRLPTLDELRSLARGCPATITGGTCAVTDDCLESSCWSDVCQGCAELNGPDPGGCYRLSTLNGDCMTSWTSSVVTDMPDDVWTVGFGGCHVLHYPKTTDLNTRCVRLGAWNRAP